MAFDQSLRNLVKSHFESGKQAPEIYKFLNKTVPIRTIQRWIEILRRKKPLRPNQRKKRPRPVRTKMLVQKVKRNVLTNKKRKAPSQLAAEGGCSVSTIRRTIKDDLGLTAYRRIKVPALTSDQIKRRLQFSRWIRKEFDHERCKSICFSDEKMFDGDGQLNSQNDVIYAESREQANKNGGLVGRHQYPLKVMVFCMITYNGPGEVVVLPSGTSYNSDFYVTKVIPKVKRDCERLIGPGFIFQQDGARCHTSNDSTQAFLDNDIPLIEPHRWPPNSPDLNPMDYFFWNEVSKRVVVKRPRGRVDLIKKIKQAVKEIPLKMIRDSIDSFRSRIHVLEKNEGGLIKNNFQ